MTTNKLRWLPSLRDMSEEQQSVINDSLTGSSLIYGPAGSGKTAVILFRAKMLIDQDKRVKIITYTKVLIAFIKAAAQDLGIPAAEISTLHSWAWDLYRRHCGNPQSAPGEDKFSAWVDGVIKVAQDNPTKLPRYDYVLVDEAQDFPPNVARFLRLMTDNLFVAGDTAQSLYENHRNFGEFAQHWRPTAREGRLLRNYRNPKTVARVAALFLGKSPVDRDRFMEIVQGRASEMKPVWHEVDSPVNQIDRIAKILGEPRGDVSIGILFRHKEQRNSLAAALKRKGIDFQIAEGDRGYSFENTGLPTLVTIHSAKGLEFDWVILPDLNESAWSGSTLDDEERRLFFVALTRSKNKVYLLSEKGKAFGLLRELIASDANLIQRPTASPSPPRGTGQTFDQSAKDNFDDPF